MDPITGKYKLAPRRAAVKVDPEGEGTFRAVFSTFNVIDHDNDVTLPGAFEKGQKVRLAQWGHAWHLPVIGTGTIDADEEQAWVDGRFNLHTTAGREHYETIKDSGDLQEWSYGYDILKWSFGSFPEGADNTVTFLESLKVHEVSPVMLGAGIGTHTESVKALATLREGATLDTEAAIVLAAMTDLSGRLRSLADLRAKEGRELSERNRERIRSHAERAEEIAKGLRELYDATAGAPKGIQRGIVEARLAMMESELAAFGIRLP